MEKQSFFTDGSRGEGQRQAESDYISFLKEHSPADISVEDYYAKKIKETDSGGPTFVVRNFTADGRVYDLFYRKNHFGYVDDPLDGAVEVYIAPLNGTPEQVAVFDGPDHSDNFMQAIGHLIAMIPKNN